MPQSGKGAQRIQHASIQRHGCIVVVGFQGPPAAAMSPRITGCEKTGQVASGVINHGWESPELNGGL